VTIDIQQNKLPGKIAIVITLLMAIGAVFVFSASANLNHTLDLNRFYEFAAIRQVIFFPLAVLTMIVFSLINYRTWSIEKGFFRTPVTYLLIISTVLLALVNWQSGWLFSFSQVFAQSTAKVSVCLKSGFCRHAGSLGWWLY